MQICNLCLNNLFLEGSLFKTISTFYHVNWNAEVLFDNLWENKGKICQKCCILQKCDLYLTLFSNKIGAIGKPERMKKQKHPIWAVHPHTHFSTKYPPGMHTSSFDVVPLCRLALCGQFIL